MKISILIYKITDSTYSGVGSILLSPKLVFRRVRGRRMPSRGIREHNIGLLGVRLAFGVNRRFGRWQNDLDSRIMLSE